MKTLKLFPAKCPKCGNEFYTKNKSVQCGKVLDNGKRCGERFEL